MDGSNVAMGDLHFNPLLRLKSFTFLATLFSLSIISAASILDVLTK